jgi:serine/threonine protein kinase
MPAPASGAPSHEPPKLVSFGKYLLLDRIATGGMAEVWLGKTIQSGTISDLLAIKRILSRYSDDEEFLRMFIDEARIAGQLQHPGIVPIHELGRVGRSMYIAMEFVWGRDLLGILRRLRLLERPFDATTAAHVGARISEALHFAHTAKDKEGAPLNVVHRDVSPQNVLVSFDGKVKLIDFGIAKAASRSTRTQAGTLKGKVGYMSPEQVRGETIDHRSDQFATGTCLYEMLTGRPLFSRPNNFDSIELVREAAVPPLAQVCPECPPRLSEIVMKALARDRDKRFESSYEMQKALSLFVAETDPGYERVSLVAWLRSLFGEEMAEEKARLDSLDVIGRPPAEPIGKRRTNTSTRLEIAAYDLLDDDEDAETKVLDDSPLSRLQIDVRPDGPYEVFFHRDDASTIVPARRTPVPPDAVGASAAAMSAAAAAVGKVRPSRPIAEDSWRGPRGDLAATGPYKRRDTELDARRTLPFGSIPDKPTEPSVMISPELMPAASRESASESAGEARPKRDTIRSEPPPGLEAAKPSEPETGERVSRPPGSQSIVDFDPAEINSQVIRALMPKGIKPFDPDARRDPAREPTEQVTRNERASSRRRALELQTPEQGRRHRTADIFFVLGALVMLLIGAGATYWWLTTAATATMEIRTSPGIPATVLVDGAPHGRVPLRIDGLSPGRHVVALVASGFETTTREVTLAPRSSAILELPMTPAGRAPAVP